MDKAIMIQETKNGYVVKMQGFTRVNGIYVFRAVDLLPMLEFIGEHAAGSKVKVDYK